MSEDKPSERIAHSVTEADRARDLKWRGAFEADMGGPVSDAVWARESPLISRPRMDRDSIESRFAAVAAELDREWDRRRAWEKKIELDLECMGKDIHGG